MMFIPLDNNSSAGAIAGIAVGAVIAIVIIIIILITIVVKMVKRRRNHIPIMYKDSIDSSSAEQGPRLLMH